MTIVCSPTQRIAVTPTNYSAATNSTWHRRAALTILFAGGGFACALQFLNPYWSMDLPSWIADRLSLTPAIPALLLSIPLYFKYGGFARCAPLVSLLVWMGASLLWGDPTERGRGLIGLVSVGITLPLAGLVNATKWHRQCAYLFAGGFLSGIVLVALSNPTCGERWGDFEVNGLAVMNSNEVGSLGVVSAILMYGAWTERGRPVGGAGRKGFQWSLALGIAATMTMAMTVSRSSLAAFAVAAWKIWRHHAQRTPSLLFLTPVFVTIAGAAFLGSGMTDRWSDRLSASDMATLNGRTEIWDTGYKVCAELDWRWIYGLGLAGIDKRLGEETDFYAAIHPIDGIRRIHSHNQYLEIIAELGLIGVMLTIWLGVSAYRAADSQDRKHGSPCRTALLGALAILAFAGAVTKMVAFPPIGALLWAMLTPPVSSSGGRRQ